MNGMRTLYNKFGVVTKVDGSGRICFRGVGRWLRLVSGDEAAWQEIQRLMRVVEEEWLSRRENVK